MWQTWHLWLIDLEHGECRNWHYSIPHYGSEEWSNGSAIVKLRTYFLSWFFFFFLISLPKCLEGWDGDVSGEITPVFTWILCFWYGLHRRCFKQHMESMHRRINVCWCWCSQKEIDSNGFRTLLKQGFWHFLDSFFTAEILLKYGLSLFCWKTYRR